MYYLLLAPCLPLLPRRLGRHARTFITASPFGLGSSFRVLQFGVGRLPDNVYADKGYRTRKEDLPKLGSVRLHISGIKRGKTKRQRRLLRSRSSIEPVIGHTKQDHRMNRNFLKGTDGDHFNALLAGSAKNIAKLLALIALNPILFKFFYYWSGAAA